MESLNDALEWIYSIRGSAWRRKLDRMERLVEILGVPKGGSRPFVHVAGTNGKGSTVTIVESMLRAGGVSTGHCVSPYVYSVRERVQTNGNLIPETDFIRVCKKVKLAVDQLCTEGYGVCTIFEVFTAMAFYYWDEQAVDFGVAEVGLGGSLDCTNIINPAVSAIVSVSWDHMEVLGGSLEEIAEEKSGVIKPGKPCVIGDLPVEARKVAIERASEVNAPISLYLRDWIVMGDRDSATFELKCLFGDFVLPRPRRLPGMIQLHNAGVAAQCFLYATENLLSREQQIIAMKKGLEEAFLPGRFEVVRFKNKTIVLDGAHNEQACSELVRTYRIQYPGTQPTILFGMLDRHDATPCADILKILSHEIRCVPINWEAAADPEKLASECGIRSWHSTLEEAINESESNIIVVTGSFYLVSDFRKLIENLEKVE